MEFNKYKELGDYHHKEFKQNTIYGQHARKVVKWIPEGKTLDIGAGDGLITSLIPGAMGIDDNALAVELAQKHGVSVILESAYDLFHPVNAEIFDNVLMADVIEHLEFPDKVMNRINKIIKSGGLLFITTPPKRNDGILHDKYHYKEYSKEELKEYVESFGYKLLEPIEEKFVRLYAKFQKI